ncbi:MAG: DUF1349 domain-containing protein, partial [Planctomycetota bacterium]
SDDFFTGLGSEWTFFDPLGDSSIALTGQGTIDAWIELTIPAGTIHELDGNENTVARVMQPTTDTDFVMEAKFESAVTETYQLQGIIAEAAQDQFQRLEFYSADDGTHVFGASVNGFGNFDIRFNVALGFELVPPMYLRAERAGTTWSLDYSSDGVNWTEAGSYEDTMPVRAVGVYAGNAPAPDGSPPPAHTTKVDYVFNSADPIEPEDGEAASACCFADGTCLELTQIGCLAAGGVPEGPGTLCSTTDCTFEACCFSDGSCADLRIVDCTFQGGLSQGAGSTCGTVNCVLDGACCVSSAVCVDDVDQVTCEAGLAGVFQGIGTSCASVDCSGVTPAGACCFDDGTCTEGFQADCEAADGTYQGDNTDCASAGCPQPNEACCFADGTCLDLSTVTCEEQGGASQGPGSDCASITCPLLGACCLGDGTCVDAQTLNDCESAGGTYQGDGTDCASTICACSGAGGDCCAANGTTGCDDPACCSAVCLVDPFCCDTEWDASCAGLAAQLCTTCGALTGACCFDDGSCEDDLAPLTCKNLGGVFQGAGTLCVDGCGLTEFASDDFFLGLDMQWAFYDPLGDSSLDLSGQGTTDAWVELTVPAGITHNLSETLNTVARIMQPTTDTDFEMEAKFESTVTQEFQTQGILVEAGQYDFQRIEFYSANDGPGGSSQTHVFVASVGGGNFVTRVNLGLGLDLPAPMYLRVNRTGTTWTVEYSGDGLNWTTAISYIDAMPVRAVGVYAGNAGASPPAHTALVDYVFNTSSPIEPEDGETGTACCLPDGSCQDVTELQCLTIGGNNQGAGVTCAAASCPQPSGACCLDGGLCEEIAELDCLAQAGTWEGADSLCTEVVCPGG